MRWAKELEDITKKLERAIGWPEGSPFLAVLSESRTLSIGTALFPHNAALPAAFFLGEEELEEAGAEGYRIQEELEDSIGRNHYTGYYRRHGRTNGTVVACRGMVGKGPEEVGSVLVFVDPASRPSLPRQALGLIDASYPNAVKAGIVAAAATDAPGRSMCLGGLWGGVRRGGLLALLLPGTADSALGLCGCEEMGPLWEVFESDSSSGSSVIRRIADPASTERDSEGRRVGMAAGLALSLEARKAGLPSEPDSIWVGVPRVPMRSMRKGAPGVGEWALFRGAAVTAEGSLLLEGPGPGAEGIGDVAAIGGKAITRIQGFQTAVDHSALSRLLWGYQMERLAARGDSQAQTTPRRPWLTLVFGGGDGAGLSLSDGRLHGGVCLGAAVLGAPGHSLAEVPEEDGVRDWSRHGPPPQRATLIHRQAACLMMLY